MRAWLRNDSNVITADDVVKQRRDAENTYLMLRGGSEIIIWNVSIDSSGTDFIPYKDMDDVLLTQSQLTRTFSL